MALDSLRLEQAIDSLGQDIGLAVANAINGSFGAMSARDTWERQKCRPENSCGGTWPGLQCRRKSALSARGVFPEEPAYGVGDQILVMVQYRNVIRVVEP